MKTLFFLIMTMLSCKATSEMNQMLERLQQLQWENRVLIIYTDEPQSVIHRLTQLEYQIDDRDIVWFVINNLEIHSNYKQGISNDLKRELTKDNTRSKNQVLLIGKDGGIKSRSQILALDDIFGKIDTMPMRINEMKEKRSP